MGEDLQKMDFELLAASLRADTADMPAWMSALATKLSGALPGRVIPHRSGLLGHGPITGITADLGAWRFALRLEHGQPIAERTHIVHNIALKSETLPLDTWIDALSASLAELADTSAHERQTILGLLQ